MILVTGGTGLVGSHLLYHLTLNNDCVLAIFRSEEKIQNTKKVFSLYTTAITPFQKIKWIKADITDIPSLEKVFSSEKIIEVYHCAGMVSFNPNDYQKMRMINIEGTANIVNFCTSFTIEKLCFVSSISTLGNSIGNNIITEENEWNNEQDNSEYAITKNGAEMEVWRGSQEGLTTIIVNPGVILGSGFTEGSSKIFTQIKNRFNFYTEGITGFVGVTDVVNIMISLMASNIKNERFILVSENQSFKDLFFTISDTLQVKKPSIRVNELTTSVFWRISSFLSKITKKEPLLTKSSAKASHHKEYYSADKLKNTLNYTFQPINDVVVEVCKTI